MSTIVYGLVGATGTGKSHRAVAVAYEHDIELIIDDGLLVHGTKVIAGTSAKREPTKVAAMKRALFYDPDHAREVRAKLAEINPAKVLILGTSTGMVAHICDVLGLPPPSRIVSIEQIASKGEIKRAKMMRAAYGKHVIPVPTFEVKTSFSGYLLDPLRVFFRRRAHPDDGLFVEKSVVRPTFSYFGRFYIADRVIRTIAARACGEATGITRVRSVSLQAGPDGIVIDIDVAVRYGQRVMDVLLVGQERAKRVVEHMTALNVIAVNVVAKEVAPE